MSAAPAGPTPARERWLLLGILAVAALVRCGAAGADLPLAVERSNAPLLDAYWYLHAAAARAEGWGLDWNPSYDLPVWTSLARVWFELLGASLASAQLLGAAVSLACVALTWRLARPGLGPRGALVTAAFLAVFYPYVALARTPLIYGPTLLVLLVAAGLWLRAGIEQGARRVVLELAAWGLVLAALRFVRPPAAALLGGLALGSLVRLRSRRLRVALLAVGGAGFLAAGVLLLEPTLREGCLEWLRGLGTFGDRSANRLGRYLSRGLDGRELLLRWLSWGSEPVYGRGSGPELLTLRGSGYLALAPAALGVALLGALRAALAWPRLSPARRELFALCAGWGLTFVGASLVLDHRPLRYFMLLASPVAVSAGYAVSACWEGPVALPPGRLSERLRACGPGRLVLIAGAGAWAWAHAVGLSVAADDARLLEAGRDGALLALGAAALGLALGARVGPRGWSRAGWVLLVLALALGSVRSLRLVLAPRWSTRAANRLTGTILPPEAVVVGSYASLLTLGQGLDRRRGWWLNTRPQAMPEALRELARVGATHLALDRQQAANADVFARFAAVGQPLEVVALIPVARPGQARWVGILILRLPRAEATLSGYERLRRRDEGDGPLPCTGGLGEMTLRAFTLDEWDGRPQRAAELRKAMADKGLTPVR